MNWDELQEKHNAEWEEFQQAYLKSWTQLHDDRIYVLKACGFITSKVPRCIHRMLDKAQKDWQQEWGIDGWRNRKLKEAQEKEATLFFERERIRRKITIGIDKPHDRQMER